MLFFTGQSKGRNFDGTNPLTIEEWCEVFDIKIPKRKSVVVKYSEMPTGTSPGAPPVRPAQNLLAAVNCNMNGRPIQIRYAEARKPLPGVQGAYEYTPRKITISHDTVFSVQDNLELYCFLAVTPQNKNSSLHEGSRIMHQFIIDDPETRAKAGMKDMTSFMEVMQSIQKMDDALIMSTAMGMRMNLNGTIVTIPITDDSTADEVRISLLEAARSHPAAFNAEWSRPATIARGKISFLMRAGVIKIERTDGVVTARWDGVNADSVIMTYSGPTPAEDAILAHIVNPNNIDKMSAQLEAAIAHHSNSAILSSPEAFGNLARIANAGTAPLFSVPEPVIEEVKEPVLEELSPAQLFDLAKKKEVIYLDLISKKVMTMVGGNPVDVLFTWKENAREYVAFVETKKSAREKLLELLK